MNRTAFLILLVLFAGAGGAFLVFDGDDQPVVTELDAEAWLSEETELAKPVELLSESEESESKSEDEESPEGLAAMFREEVEGEQGEAVRVLVVQVWNGKRGVPAIEADVFFVDGFEGPELKDPFAQHWSSLAESNGEKFRTDANGRVELPGVEQWAIVTAQSPGAYGFKKVGRKHRRVETITLTPDETLTVRVVGNTGRDGEERPVASVPVGVVQRVPERQAAKLFEEMAAQMKDLERAYADVERFVRANPGRRGEVAPRARMIRERQGQVKAQMGQLKRQLNAGKNGKRSKRNAKLSKAQAKKRARSQARNNIPVIVRPHLRARRRTDENGIAVFRHFQLYRSSRESWWEPSHENQFEAVLLMPLQKPEALAFQGRPVPTETLELRLPPTGSIALRTVDRDGRPYTHPVHGDLRMKTGESVPWARLRQRKEQNETEIVFPFIGLGLEFEARCRLDDEDFKWRIASMFGPRNPGERVTVDVVVAPSEGMLFGRLLGADGQPIPGLRPSFLINTSAGRLEGEDVTTDKDGRFHLPYQVRDQHRAPYRLEIRHNTVRPVAGLAMDLAALPRSQVTDLGDLQLDSFGVIATGNVVDDRGVPIRGATVQLQRDRDVGRDKPRRKYVDEAFVVARSDKAGRYEMFGELESGHYRLRVQARNHFPFESPDIGGSKQIDLQLLRNSKVVGTVVLPEFLSSKQVRVFLQSAVNAKQRREDRLHGHRGKQYVYIDWVRPGLYNLMIRVNGFPDPVLRIDGFELQPGQQGIHPRLTDLDLGALLHRYVLTAVDENGRRVQPDWPLIAKIQRLDGKTAHIGFPWKGKGGKLEIISASPQLEVWPRANGYRPEYPSSLLSPGENQLRLLKYPPVELHLPGMRQLVGQAMVWIKLHPAAPAAGSPRGLAAWDGPSTRVGRWYTNLKRRETGVMLSPRDTAQIPLIADGKYRLIAYLLATGQKRTASAVAVTLGELDLRVQPGSGLQRVTVTVAADLVQKGMTELATREAAARQNK